MPVGVVELVVHGSKLVFNLVVGAGKTHNVVAGVYLLDIAVQGAEVEMCIRDSLLPFVKRGRVPGLVRVGYGQGGAYVILSRDGDVILLLHGV